MHSRGARYALRRRSMLHHLRNAAALIPVTGNWPKAKLLAEEIQTFRRRKWSAHRSARQPPASFTDLEKELFRLLQAAGDGKAPESANRIFELLEGAGNSE